MPVTHRHKAMRIDSLADQLRLQRLRLPLREAAYGRSSSNGRVVVLHLAGAGGGNQFGQSLSPEAGKREVNNVGIAEKVIKERLYRSQRVGTAELKKNNSHTPCCARHPLRFPRTGESTPIRGQSQCGISDCRRNDKNPMSGATQPIKLQMRRRTSGIVLGPP